MGKFMRGVSIIGVGDSKQYRPTEGRDYIGLGHEEVLALACHEAYADAGVNPRDIDAWVMPQVFPNLCGHTLGMHAALATWIGLRGKPACHLENACATSYVALAQAARDIASGQYDCVLVAGAEFGNDIFGPADRSYDLTPRGPTTEVMWKGEVTKQYVGRMIFAPAYRRHDPTKSSGSCTFEIGEEVMRRDNLTPEEFDNARIAITYHGRRAAALNPKAYKQKPFEEEAAEAGLSVAEYMKSDKHSPWLGPYLRVAHGCVHTNAAGAIVLCATDLVEKYCTTGKTPIQILGTGSACYAEGEVDHMSRCNKEAFKAAFEMSGIKSEDIDYLANCNMYASEDMLAAEDSGFVPEGKAAEYALAGRFAFDGDKPITTNGGDIHAGHAYGVAAIPIVAEAVRQMRGECGPRQVKKIPKTTVVRGMGGSHTVVAAVLQAK